MKVVTRELGRVGAWVGLVVLGSWGAGCGDEASAGRDVRPDTVEVDAGDTVEPDAAEVDDAAEVQDSVEVEDGADVAEVADTTDTADTVDSGGEPDGADADGQGEVHAPTCGDGAQDPGEACDDGDTDDLDGCDRRCALTDVVRPPAPGEVILQELMIDPARVSDLAGEWIELASVVHEEVNLSGCELRDAGSDRVLLDLDGGLTLEAEGLLVLGPNADKATNGGAVIDVPYTTMLLDDVADEVTLVCGDVLIDAVAWVPYTWPVIAGRSLGLDPSRRDASDNDQRESWCASQGVYGKGDRGSPGAPNPACPHLDRQIDACRLASDADLVGYRGHPVTVALALEEAGLTDLSPGVDTSPQLVVELGLGPVVSKTEPLEDRDFDAFAWSRARPEPGWSAPLGSIEDRWQGEVTGAELGPYAVVGRASRDGGATWRYCDLGPEPALLAAELVAVEVGETPCAEGACLTPEAPRCAEDGVRLVGFEAEGLCLPTGPETFTCAYLPALEDCGALARACAPEPEGATCSAVPRSPRPGELVLSELMLSPSAAVGQWVELVSLADEPLNLTGCTLSASGAEPQTFSLDTPTVLGRRGRLVLGASAELSDNGGAPVARAWGEGFTLDPLEGELTLGCGEPLDALVWDGSWPRQAGTAMSLSPYRLGAADNDRKESWCRAVTSYGEGDRGTPGAANPDCPGDVVPVESCQLAGPALLVPPAGTQGATTVRVVARAITGKSAATDVSPKLMVEVGLAPRQAAPATIPAWSRATPDTTWSATNQGVDPAEDRYRASFRAPAVGTWDLYARATADGGNSWAFCDLDGVAPASSARRPIAVEPVASACDPDPCVTPPGPICAPVASGSPTVVLGRSGPVTCSLDAADRAVCAFTDVVLEDCATRGAVCADGACVGFPRVAEPGEVVISELMIAPLVGGTPNELGEWLELHNASDDALDLNGCELRSGSATDGLAERWALPLPPGLLTYVLQPGASLTLARSGVVATNGGVSPAAVWSGLALANAADWVELWCGPDADSLAPIDLVAWSVEEGWAVPVGKSLQLSGAYLDVRDNDLSSYWCAPGPATPRMPNRVCPGDGVLDACRLAVEVEAASAEQPFEAAVSILDVGVTDLRPVVDPATAVEVELGVGPADADPRTSLSWTWAEASPDPDWDDRLADPELSGWDRWAATLTTGRVGELAVLGRVSFDGGRRWVLCGTGGFADDPGDGAALMSTAGICAPNPCTNPEPATCSGTLLTAKVATGTCAVEDGEARCSYASQTFQCAGYGGCNAANASCNQPPARPTSAGAVIFSELMRDSTLPAPDRGEWVELHNPGQAALDVRGCELVDQDGQRVTLASAVPEVLMPGGHLVLAQAAAGADNGGIPTSLGAPRPLGLTLKNGAGSLALVCGGVTIDEVAWSWDWPGATGVAMQLDRLSLGHLSNDLRASWCAATPSYGTLGNRGSPGNLNLACPASSP